MGEDSVTNLFGLFSYRVKSNKPPTNPKLLQLFAERRFSVLQVKAPHLWSRLCSSFGGAAAMRLVQARSRPCSAVGDVGLIPVCSELQLPNPSRISGQGLDQ